MNKNLLLFYFVSIIFTCLLAPSIQAQVTIGSSYTPRGGTLLDLKMNDASTGITSTKGLGLPRVVLVAIDSLLPMFQTDESYIDGTSKLEQDALHIGLVVYNTVEKRYLCKGVHVWDGTKWDLLYPVDRPDITVNDVDGNTYRARWFGDDCDGAYWTIDDMRTRKFPNGDPIDAFIENDPTNSIEVENLQVDVPYIMYPENHITTYDVNPKLGLFYSLPAALNSKSISDGKDHGNDPKQNHIQGICPDGWHLPSDYEWSILEKEIATYPKKYSTNTGTSWNDSYFTDRPSVNAPFFHEDSTAWRGNYALNMLLPTIPPIYADYGFGEPIVVNDSDPSSDYYQSALGKSNHRGFDIQLYSAGNETGTHTYNYWSGYWTSSNAGYDDIAWYRFFDPTGEEPSSDPDTFRPTAVKRKFNAHITDEGEIYYNRYAFNVRCMKYIF